MQGLVKVTATSVRNVVSGKWCAKRIVPFRPLTFYCVCVLTGCYLPFVLGIVTNSYQVFNKFSVFFKSYYIFVDFSMPMGIDPCCFTGRRG